MKIAIDVMGGDHAPFEIIEGALLALDEHDDIELVLVGNEEVIKPHIDLNNERIQVLHTSEVIATGEQPVRAVRRKPDSSLVTCVRLVKEHQVDACISAGDTGAYMAAGSLLIGRAEGIERPALAALLPTVKGTPVLLLDAGANVDARPHHLLHYAVMGEIYAKHILKVEQPRLGLLNVGVEESKGNELIKNTYPLLLNQQFNFTNIEARDIPFGAVDVVICDGFSGNIVLKLSEGVAGSLIEMLNQVMNETLFTKLAARVLKPGLKQLQQQIDYSAYGGVPLLGLKGICIKAHGSSKAEAIKNAVCQAKNCVKQDIASLIRNEFEKASEENGW